MYNSDYKAITKSDSADPRFIGEVCGMPICNLLIIIVLRKSPQQVSWDRTVDDQSFTLKAKMQWLW